MNLRPLRHPTGRVACLRAETLGQRRGDGGTGTADRRLTPSPSRPPGRAPKRPKAATILPA